MLSYLLLVSALVLGEVQACDRSQATHEVYVKTGIKRRAGSATDVYIRLKDDNGQWSEEEPLDTTVHSFQENTTDMFYVNASPVRRVSDIYIRRGSENANDTWFLELVTIKEVRKNKQIIFPVTRWISANDELYLEELEYTLPSQDKYSQQRSQELEKIRQMFKLEEVIPGAPRLLRDVPPQESFFLESYEQFKNQTKLEMAMLMRNPANLIGVFQSLKEYQDIFTSEGLPLPKGLSDWMHDMNFAYQRLIGVNPTTIELCTEIPARFAVTSAMVEPFLEGMTLEAALEAKKIFIVDYSTDLEGVMAYTAPNFVPAPFALFYLNQNGDLYPLAIQLMPEPADENPVFLPSDPEYTWLLAKMWFNLADASIHQAVTHLGFTHLIMETVASTTHRQLSPSHPMYQLIMPHFHQLLAVGRAAKTTLMNPGGSVDQATNIKRAGAFEILRRKWQKWTLQNYGNVIKNMNKRGVYSSSVLPDYLYRDDAVKLWRAISQYVERIVEDVYDTNDKLARDNEIQAWAAELSNPDEINMKGVPRRFSSHDELVEVLTFIIFTSSVQHTAVNSPQYNQYAFSPNYPIVLLGEPPKNKTALEEADVVKALPPKIVLMKTIAVASVLSSSGGNRLGYFETNYSYHPDALKSLEKLRKDLKRIAKEIEDRTPNTLGGRYDYLHPNNVRNSISD